MSQSALWGPVVFTGVYSHCAFIRRKFLWVRFCWSLSMFAFNFSSLITEELEAQSYLCCSAKFPAPSMRKWREKAFSMFIKPGPTWLPKSYVCLHCQQNNALSYLKLRLLKIHFFDFSVQVLYISTPFKKKLSRRKSVYPEKPNV